MNMKMKTSVRGPVPVLAAILILASGSSAHAQVTLGLRAGAMRGTLGVADEVGFPEGVSPRYGAHAAVSVAYPLNDLLGLVAEVGYAPTGRGAHDPGARSDLRCALGVRLRRFLHARQGLPPARLSARRTYRGPPHRVLHQAHSPEEPCYKFLRGGRGRVPGERLPADRGSGGGASTSAPRPWSPKASTAWASWTSTTARKGLPP